MKLVSSNAHFRQEGVLGGNLHVNISEVRLLANGRQDCPERMVTGDDVGLCRGLVEGTYQGGSATVDRSRLSACDGFSETTPVCCGCGETVQQVRTLNAHNEEN